MEIVIKKGITITIDESEIVDSIVDHNLNKLVIKLKDGSRFIRYVNGDCLFL